VASADEVGADSAGLQKLMTDLTQVRKSTAAFYSCVPTGMHGSTCILWANLTPFPLQRVTDGELPMLGLMVARHG
jgi:hypothetical protein